VATGELSGDPRQQLGKAGLLKDNKLKWYVIIHLTFVLSALGMAYVDKMNKH
jgi:uncharacterized membrane protein YqhA